MSGNGNKKRIRISKEQSPKKVSSPKGLKNIFNAIGRRIFSRIHKSEVDYGQTLSKKRRKNCILKSVSSLSCPDDDNGFLLRSPYHINFRFTREDPHFRGNVINFQKIDLEEACCEKCLCTLEKGDSLSRFSISSDSACDVSSESSCDDEDCRYRKPVPKAKTRLKKKKSKSCADVSSKNGTRTLENFIRIHNENFKDGVDTLTENFRNSLFEWTNEEPKYEPLVRFEEPKPCLDDSDYDILVTKSDCRVVEPSYENLKLMENLYEMPRGREALEAAAEDDSGDKAKVPSSKTYDEVIESLKLWHRSSRYPDEAPVCSCCGERVENEFNHCLESYEALENDFNNDIEEFCC